MRLVLFFTRAFAHRFASGRQRGRRACSVCEGRFLPPLPALPSTQLDTEAADAAWLNFAKVGRRNQRGNDEDRLALSSGGTAGRRPEAQVGGRPRSPLPLPLQTSRRRPSPLASDPVSSSPPPAANLTCRRRNPTVRDFCAPLPEKCCCCLLAQALASSWRSSQCSALILLRHCV